MGSRWTGEEGAGIQVTVNQCPTVEAMIDEMDRQMASNQRPAIEADFTDADD